MTRSSSVPRRRSTTSRRSCEPGTYLAFDVAYAVPPVEEAPARRNGYVTFGCFATQYKLTPQVLHSWADILNGAPRAKLLVKNQAMHAECNRVSLLQRFAEYSIDPTRITLEPGAPHYDFLAAYARVDVALDPFPYNGGTTTSEALWQGVPVLCFEGDRWAAVRGQHFCERRGSTSSSRVMKPTMSLAASNWAANASTGGWQCVTGWLGRA